MHMRIHIHMHMRFPPHAFALPFCQNMMYMGASPLRGIMNLECCEDDMHYVLLVRSSWFMDLSTCEWLNPEQSGQVFSHSAISCHRKLLLLWQWSVKRGGAVEKALIANRHCAVCWQLGNHVHILTLFVIAYCPAKPIYMWQGA